MIEFGIGDWTGRTFDQLGSDPLWQQFSTHRTRTRPPGGETIGEVQVRAVRAVRNLASTYPDGRVVVVSHGDTLKSLLMFALRMNLDDVHRFEISPAAISVVRWFEPDPVVLSMNALEV